MLNNYLKFGLFLWLGFFFCNHVQSQENAVPYKNMIVNFGGFSYEADVLSPLYFSIERNRYGQKENKDLVTSLFLSAYYGQQTTIDDPGVIIGVENTIRGNELTVKKLSLGYKIGKQFNQKSNSPLLGRLVVSADVTLEDDVPFGLIVTNFSTDHYGIGIGAELNKFINLSDKRQLNFGLEINGIGPYFERLGIDNPQIQPDRQTESSFVFSVLPDFIVAKIGISIWRSKAPRKSNSRGKKKSKRKKKRR